MHHNENLTNGKSLRKTGNTGSIGRISILLIKPFVCICYCATVLVLHVCQRDSHCLNFCDGALTKMSTDITCLLKRNSEQHIMFAISTTNYNGLFSADSVSLILMHSVLGIATIVIRNQSTDCARNAGNNLYQDMKH